MKLCSDTRMVSLPCAARSCDYRLDRSMVRIEDLGMTLAACLRSEVRIARNDGAVAGLRDGVGVVW